jgi:AsmA protein
MAMKKSESPAEFFRRHGEKMKQLAVISAALLVFAVASVGGLYAAFSPSFLTVEIAKAVAESTGRTLTFSARPRLKVWPEPGVSFKDVRLSGPPGMNDRPFADAEHMIVKIGARALIKRRVDIQEIRLINPKLNLIVDRSGRSNWIMMPKAKDLANEAAQDSGGAFELPPIYVEGGTVAFSDERSEQSFDLGRLDLLLKLASVEGPVEVKGSADWRRDRVSFSLFIKSPQMLTGRGSPLDLNLSGSWLNFAFSGRGALSKEVDLAGTVQGGTRSIRGLMRWAGLDIGEGKGLGTLHTTGSLSLKGKTLNIAKGQFRLDGMKAQGEASLSLDSVKPKLAAALDIDQIDLSQYLMPGADSSIDAGKGIESWNNAPIDFSFLNSIDAKALLRAERLTYGRATTTKAVIDATVDGGVLNAKIQQIDMYGGKGQGQLVLNGSQKIPTMQLGFQGKGLDGLRLLRDLWDFNRIEGQTELALALGATGRSQREMIASLRGTAELNFADGRVKGINMAKMLESVSQKIVSGWMPAGSEASEFQLLKADFKISDGIAESANLELMGPSLRLKGNGLLDLPKCEIDFKIEPEIVHGNTADGSEFMIPIIVKGPWAEPKFYPDIAGILENPEAAYETLKTLVGKVRLEQPEVTASGKAGNAGGVAGEELSVDQGTSTPTVDLIKKRLNGNTLELMKGFTSEGSPESVFSEQ